MARREDIIIGTDSRPAKRGADQFAQSMKKVSSSAKKTAKDVNKVDDGFKRVSKSSKTLKTALGFLTGGTLAIGLRSLIKATADFELEMTKVKGVSGATEQEFSRMVNTARRLGATTQFSASQAASGLLFLSRAGFNATESINTLPDTLNLAAAAQLQLGEAADITSNVMAQFSLESSQAERVVDALVATANRANTDVRQLAEAFKISGPLSGALGISVEETAAAIGVLGNSGIQASLAGTNLRGMMAALLGPANDAQLAIQNLGLTLDDVNPEKVGLIGAFEAFANANLDATDALTIFDRRNATAAITIAKNINQFKDLFQGVKDVRGETQDLADDIKDTLSGSIKNLKSAVESIFISTGDTGLAVLMKDFIDGLTTSLRLVDELIKKMQNVTGIHGSIVNAAAQRVALANAEVDLRAGIAKLNFDLETGQISKADYRKEINQLRENRHNATLYLLNGGRLGPSGPSQEEIEAGRTQALRDVFGERVLDTPSVDELRQVFEEGARRQWWDALPDSPLVRTREEEFQFAPETPPLIGPPQTISENEARKLINSFNSGPQPSFPEIQDVENPLNFEAVEEDQIGLTKLIEDINLELDQTIEKQSALEQFWDAFAARGTNAAEQLGRSLGGALNGISSALARVSLGTLEWKDAVHQVTGAIAQDLLTVAYRLILIKIIESTISIFSSGSGLGGTQTSTANLSAANSAVGASASGFGAIAPVGTAVSSAGTASIGSAIGSGALNVGANGAFSIPQGMTGGVFDGPRTGYLVELHGKERVEPLGEGRKVSELHEGQGQGVQPIVVNQTINVQAQDAQSFDDRTMSAITQNLREMTTAVVNEIRITPEHREALR